MNTMNTTPNTVAWPVNPQPKSNMSSEYWSPHQSSWVMPAPTDKGYANDVEIEINEHDAVLKFWRRRGNSKTFVCEVTLPISALSTLRLSDEIAKRAPRKK